jgi:hypothetical protein
VVGCTRNLTTETLGLRGRCHWSRTVGEGAVLRVALGVVITLMGLFSAVGGERWAAMFGGRARGRPGRPAAPAYRLAGTCLVVMGVLLAAGVLPS